MWALHGLRLALTNPSMSIPAKGLLRSGLCKDNWDMLVFWIIHCLLRELIYKDQSAHLEDISNVFNLRLCFWGDNPPGLFIRSFNCQEPGKFLRVGIPFAPHTVATPVRLSAERAKLKPVHSKIFDKLKISGELVQIPDMPMSWSRAAEEDIAIINWALLLVYRDLGDSFPLGFWTLRNRRSAARSEQKGAFWFANIRLGALGWLWPSISLVRAALADGRAGRIIREVGAIIRAQRALRWRGGNTTWTSCGSKRDDRWIWILSVDKCGSSEGFDNILRQIDHI